MCIPSMTFIFFKFLWFGWIKSSWQQLAVFMVKLQSIHSICVLRSFSFGVIIHPTSRNSSHTNNWQHFSSSWMKTTLSFGFIDKYPDTERTLHANFGYKGTDLHTRLRFYRPDGVTQPQLGAKCDKSPAIPEMKYTWLSFLLKWKQIILSPRQPPHV